MSWELPEASGGLDGSDAQGSSYVLILTWRKVLKTACLVKVIKRWFSVLKGLTAQCRDPIWMEVQCPKFSLPIPNSANNAKLSNATAMAH